MFCWGAKDLFSPLHGHAYHLPMADAGGCCLPGVLPATAVINSTGERPVRTGGQAAYLSTHTIKRGPKTTCQVSELLHSPWLVEGQAPGPVLSLSRSSGVVLDTLVHLSGPQLYVHKKGYVWLQGLQKRPSSPVYDLGRAYGFLSLVCSAR